MTKVIVKVKDKSKTNDLKKYGNIVYQSPILNMVILEVNERKIEFIEKDENVYYCERDSEGELMPT